MQNNRVASFTLLLLPFLFASQPSLPTASKNPPDTTYAQRLGYPKDARILLIHVDDAGMSLESNEGAIAALTRGAAT
jgi:hypothetical protein